MTVELTPENLCSVIEDALKASENLTSLSEPVTMTSIMGSPKEWDSLTFVSVFLGIAQAFDVELDDDDAVHFLGVQGIHNFLKEIL
jgi:acyl carrier protein